MGNKWFILLTLKNTGMHRSLQKQVVGVDIISHAHCNPLILTSNGQKRWDWNENNLNISQLEQLECHKSQAVELETHTPLEEILLHSAPLQAVNLLQ